MTADLDPIRINRDVQKYVEEIIQHLQSADGVTVNISLEIHAETEEGFSPQIVRTIKENVETLKPRNLVIEEELK
jgi:hypothetical protein